MIATEAVAELKKGKKIHHISWEQKEYIYLGENGHFYDNSHNLIENFNFFDLVSDNSGKDEWEIWED